MRVRGTESVCVCERERESVCMCVCVKESVCEIVCERERVGGDTSRTDQKKDKS